ncbi:MAG: competence/damage-inducible protein A [Phycisphaerales bacterium]|nr:competence/damage-inducible protein A [Phycisphaerales bacterium]MCB9864164.1 competence/damage-inducible protein A [Phycisphaerales bacterium]
MIAQLISIGNEITSGQTVDTNSAWLAQRLAEFGVPCVRHQTIADEIEPIRHAIDDAAGRSDLVIITGGLGPTPDDLTRQALADAMGVELEFHEPSLQHIEAYFAQRKRRMHEGNRQQAYLPAGSDALHNERGTAPGIRARLHNADIYCVPGVPSEMRDMFAVHIRPQLEKQSGGSAMRIGILRTIGVSESEIGERLKDLMRRDRNPTVGTSAADLVISIRVVAHGPTRDIAQSSLDADLSEIRVRLGNVIFGENDDTVESAVGKLLIERQLTIATAESCTGGLVAKRLTDLPGSSAYLRSGFITYANESKTDLLGVPASLIAEHGAVSESVAKAMAENCRTRSRTDIALSTTGIAGPTGGTPTKPVGLVYVGIATTDETVVKELRLGDNITRDQVRERTVRILLNMLRLRLLRRADHDRNPS